MQVHLVDVFTKAPGQGNPGAVVLDSGGLTGPVMAGVAARLGLETTFVDGTTLRYYQPSGTAMTLCGHGTLAALAVMGRAGRFKVSTPAGDLPVDVQPELLGLAMPGVSFRDPVAASVAAQALGLDPAEIDGPVQPGGSARPKLLVPVRSTAVLDALRPESRQIEEACATTETTGIYVFTCKARTFGATADARHFPAGAAIYEDPVTGVAAVALAWYLWKHGVAPGCGALKIEQGHAMGRPGRMLVKQEPDGRTWLYGQAVVREQVEV
ncbi:MAG TPA: PhzF family phenazine biosynthesis protein [Symbiobacteriaceae bacterium]|jgi:PhzF family phenazine biosynthesis protein